MIGSDQDDEPITEQFELPEPESMRASNRDRGVLLRVDGPSNGQVHSIDGSELVIGRSASANVQLPDEGISRRHALLMHARGHYFIQDLESSNGTFLEGRRVRRAPLMEGDLIQLGPHATFRFCMMDAKQERAMMRLYEETTVDPLTGAHNRRFIEKRLDEELAYALRHRSPLSIALLDVDYFKHVNDRHGHAAGDLVLRRIVEVVGQELRTEDVLARYGGEELLLVLRGIPLPGAARVAERVRMAVQNAQFSVGRVNLRVTLSAGCASLGDASLGDEAAQTRETLIAEADERLYQAKQRGRNQICAG
jgi:diguanylate cyclase (GGDEF)-like protein